MPFEIQWKTRLPDDNDWRPGSYTFSSKKAAIDEAEEQNKRFDNIIHRVVNQKGHQVWPPTPEEVSE